LTKFNSDKEEQIEHIKKQINPAEREKIMQQEMNDLKQQIRSAKFDLKDNFDHMKKLEKATYWLLNKDMEARLRFQTMIHDWNSFGEYVINQTKDD